MNARRHDGDDTAEARETRERILDAAQKLFGEKGLEAASVGLAVGWADSAAA